MYFSKISQLLSFAALSVTALAYSPAGNYNPGLAARNIDSEVKILSPRHEPPKSPRKIPPYPWGSWLPDPAAGSGNNGDNNSNAGRRSRRGTIQAR